MTFRYSFFGLTCAAVFCVVLSSCAPKVHNQGKHLDPEDIQKVSVMQHTKQDVMQILGSPTHVDKYAPDRWHYIARITHQTAFLEPEEKDFDLVTVVFNKIGRVEEILTKDENKIEDITLVSRETPTSGKDMGFFEQIFGNFGRFQRQSSDGMGS